MDTKSGPNQLKAIREILSDYSAEIKDFEKKKIDEDNVNLELHLKLINLRLSDNIISDILDIKGIEKAKWMKIDKI